jgi:hypothetical protein
MTKGARMENRQKEKVDTGLIRMFLDMTPEERILSNDNTARTILELRHALEIQKGFGFEELIDDCLQIDFQGDKINVLALEKMVELKRDSIIPENRYRMQILEETLRALERGNNKG